VGDPSGNAREEPLPYYLPVENCTIAHPNSYGWWWGPEVEPRSVEELIGIRFLCEARNANCIFNVTPSPEGKIPEDQAQALFEMRDKRKSLSQRIRSPNVVVDVPFDIVVRAVAVPAAVKRNNGGLRQR
jgi:alpha-L-fucosidase